jgi:uncharacterized protein
MLHSAFNKGLPESAQRVLLTVAREALLAAAEGRRYSPQPVSEDELQALGACFVTLTCHGQLRGCIGSLEAHRPLLQDVAENAKSAATRDPRFPPVRPEEVADLHIEISVLTPPQEIQFSSQEDLLSQIKPFVDGLVLEEGHRRGTFLPLVWQQLPEPEDFLRHLKQKAGLPQNYWSNTLRMYRYHAQVFEE